MNDLLATNCKPVQLPTAYSLAISFEPLRESAQFTAKCSELRADPQGMRCEQT